MVLQQAHVRMVPPRPIWAYLTRTASVGLPFFFIIFVNGRLCVFNLALFWSRSLWGAEGEGPARGPPAMAARRCPAAPQDGGSAAAMGRPRPGEL